MSSSSTSVGDLAKTGPVSRQVPPTAPAKGNWLSKNKKMVGIGVFVVVVIVIIVVVVVLVGGGSNGGATCGADNTKKPVAGDRLFDMCPSASGGVLTCDDAKSEWYCKCGTGANADLRTKKCTTDENPVAYCGTNSTPACGCDGKLFAKGDLDWCIQGKGDITPTVICDYDSTDKKDSGTLTCKCGKAQTGGAGPVPMMVSSNPCPSPSTWACVTPQGDAAKTYTGIMDCNCASNSGTKSLDLALQTAATTTCTGCTMPTFDSLDLTKDLNAQLSSACGCRCTCDTDTGWGCPPK